jgi:hypothetical protein
MDLRCSGWAGPDWVSGFLVGESPKEAFCLSDLWYSSYITPEGLLVFCSLFVAPARQQIMPQFVFPTISTKPAGDPCLRGKPKVRLTGFFAYF